MGGELPETDTDDIDFENILDANVNPASIEGEAPAAPALQPTPPRRAFDPRIARDRKNLEAGLKEVLAAATKQFMSTQGAKGALYTATSIARVGIKSTQGSSKVFGDIVGRILTRIGAEESQTAIRNAVQAKHPAMAVTKDWTKPLPAWASKKLKTRIQCSAPPFNTIKVDSGITLSKLHAAAKAAYLRHLDGATTYKASISVSDDAVLVNQVQFKVTENRAKGKSYKIVRMSVATLEKALQRA